MSLQVEVHEDSHSHNHAFAPPISPSSATASSSGTGSSSNGAVGVKFGGVRHESGGQHRSFGGDWQKRSVKSSQSMRGRSYSKKSNKAFTIALEQTVHMTTADKEQLVQVLMQDIRSSDASYAGRGRSTKETKSRERKPSLGRLHSLPANLSQKHPFLPNADAKSLPKLADSVSPLGHQGSPDTQKAWGSPQISPKRHGEGPETGMGINQDGTVFGQAHASVQRLILRRESSKAATSTFTGAEVDDFLSFVDQVASHLPPMALRKCSLQLSRSYKNARGSKSLGSADLINKALLDGEGDMEVEQKSSRRASDASALSIGDLAMGTLAGNKNRFLTAVHRVKRGLYTNRVFMHSHNNSMTTRDALLQAGATNSGMDLAAMLRILDTLGFPLSSDEAKAAEKYVAKQKNGRVGLPDFEMFLSDLSATKAAVKRAKLRGSGARIFLGGSCNPTTWRKDIAIPLLTAHNVPFFNPQVDDWDPSLVVMEAQAKAEAPVLLFVIDSATRAIASMIEVVELISEGYCIVVVIHEIVAGVEVAGQIPSAAEIKDLNRARAYLADVISRHALPVFSNIGTAVQHSITLWRGIMKERQKLDKNGPTKPSLTSFESQSSRQLIAQAQAVAADTEVL